MGINEATGKAGCERACLYLSSADIVHNKDESLAERTQFLYSTVLFLILMMLRKTTLTVTLPAFLLLFPVAMHSFRLSSTTLATISAPPSIYVRLMTTKQLTRFYKPKSDDLEEYAMQEISKSATNEVDVLLEKMPLSDKYSLLLQSYGSRLLDTGSRDNALMEKMDTLLLEMMKKSLSPDDKSIEYFISAAASFCNVQRISQTIKLLKRGNNSGLLTSNGGLVCVCWPSLMYPA